MYLVAVAFSNVWRYLVNTLAGGCGSSYLVDTNNVTLSRHRHGCHIQQDKEELCYLDIEL